MRKKTKLLMALVFGLSGQAFARYQIFVPPNLEMQVVASPSTLAALTTAPLIVTCVVLNNGISYTAAAPMTISLSAVGAPVAGIASLPIVLNPYTQNSTVAYSCTAVAGLTPLTAAGTFILSSPSPMNFGFSL